jgi:small neutral amino acid transporter SnatA (MarC family)
VGALRPLTRASRAGLGLALLLILAVTVVAPPERCHPVTPDELRASAQGAVDWFAVNQNPDGTWLYEYDREENSASPDYNIVRHAGAVMGLQQAATAGLTGAGESADRGLAWALDRLIRRADWSAVEWRGEVEVGASALLTAALLIRREATGDPRYDPELRRLGRFLLAQTEPSGAVLASYSQVREAPVPGEYSKYFTGEAYWALTLLREAFPDEEWGEGADRVGTYLVSSRDESEGHWPPVPDHWAAYGLAETAESGRRPLTGEEVDYARSQAGSFGASVRWVSQRFGPWGAVVRGPDVLRGGGYGVFGEALTGHWLAAQAEPRLGGIGEPAGERAGCIAGLAIAAQSDADEAAEFARPERVEGAWFRDGVTRMDDQQHAISGLLRTVPIASGLTPESDDDAPPALLWAVIIVLALNPPLTAFGVPRAGRTRREVAALAAVGGALGGLAVCAVAAAGGPLLDALDVSDPSFRTAAGIVAALAGALDLFRRPPSPEPALPGRRAALVPVAFPLVARPALVVLALGAGAEGNFLVTVGAMAVGAVALTALAARAPTEGPGGRALRWAARLLAAGLVAAGVVLTIDGALDV